MKNKVSEPTLYAELIAEIRIKNEQIEAKDEIIKSLHSQNIDLLEKDKETNKFCLNCEDEHKKEIEDLSDYFATLQKSYDKEIEDLKERLRLAEKGMYVLNNSSENNQKLQKIKDDLKTAKRCIDFQIIKCENQTCLNRICPLHKDFNEQIFSNYSQQDKTSSNDGYTDNVSVPRGDKPADKPSDAGSPLRSAITGGDNLICECGRTYKNHHKNESRSCKWKYTKFKPKKQKEEKDENKR